MHHTVEESGQGERWCVRQNLGAVSAKGNNVVASSRDAGKTIGNIYINRMAPSDTNSTY